MNRADPLEGTSMSSEHPCKAACTQTKQLSQCCVLVGGDVAILLQPERVADLSGKYSPLHGHPLVSTALQEFHSLEVLLEGKKVCGCHTFNVEVFNKRHMLEGLLDSRLKCSPRFVTCLHTPGLDPFAAILGTANHQHDSNSKYSQLNWKHSHEVDRLPLV